MRNHGGGRVKVGLSQGEPTLNGLSQEEPRIEEDNVGVLALKPVLPVECRTDCIREGSWKKLLYGRGKGWEVVFSMIQLVNNQVMG